MNNSLDILSILSGFLQGMLSGEQLKRQEEEQQRERERQQVAMQVQVNEILSRQRLAEQQVAMEEEKLQMAKEAHTWQKQQAKLLQRNAIFELEKNKAQFIATKATLGMQAGKTPEQIAKEVSAVIGEPVSSQDIVLYADRQPVFQMVDELLAKSAPTAKTAEQTKANLRNIIRSRFGQLADDPMLLRYISNAVDTRITQLVTLEEAQKRQLQTETAIRQQADIAKMKLAHRLQLAEISAQGAQSRRTMWEQVKIQSQLREAQQKAVLQQQFPNGLYLQPPAFEMKDVPLNQANPFGEEQKRTQDVLQRTAQLYMQSLGIKKPVPFNMWRNTNNLIVPYYQATLTAWGGFYVQAMEMAQRKFRQIGGKIDASIGAPIVVSASNPLKETLRSLAQDVNAGKISEAEALSVIENSGLGDMEFFYQGDNGKPYRHSVRFLFRVFRDIESKRGKTAGR